VPCQPFSRHSATIFGQRRGGRFSIACGVATTSPGRLWCLCVWCMAAAAAAGVIAVAVVLIDIAVGACVRLWTCMHGSPCTGMRAEFLLCPLPPLGLQTCQCLVKARLGCATGCTIQNRMHSCRVCADASVRACGVFVTLFLQ